MTMSTATDIEVQELDCRKNDGIHVALLWNSHTGRVSVAVEAERSGEAFKLEVDSADVLTAFHHPYAYHAARAASSGGWSQVDSQQVPPTARSLPAPLL